MREDARRRFTFGITIEDTQTRFWFTSRSVILVSTPFDFMTVSVSQLSFGLSTNAHLQDHAPLIRMVNFLTYASQEQLGYDLTMTRLKDDSSRIQFEIETDNGRTFRTTKVLADFAADSLLGRGTRVWEGYFMDQPDRKRAVKDVWVESDRELEGETLKKLREAYAKLEERDHIFENYFLTAELHGIVKHSGNIEDDTLTMMNGKSLPTDEVLNLKVPRDIAEPSMSRYTSHAVSSGMGPSPQEIKRVHERLAIRNRRHYRIFFDEVGTPLYAVMNLSDHFKALRDAIIGPSDSLDDSAQFDRVLAATEILFKLGYVHRDISSGNVLFYNGGGRLSDLEYCKPFKQDGTHDVRTVRWIIC
jgi:hypothetical protein